MINKNPTQWLNTYHSIRARCNDKNNKYHKKGIKALISKEELKFLWFRDNGCLLNRPSIDRLDSDKNYTLNNCRYIELSENSRLGVLTLNGRWTLKHDKCIECGGRGEHSSKGVCRVCVHYKRRLLKEGRVPKLRVRTKAELLRNNRGYKKRQLQEA